MLNLEDHSTGQLFDAMNVAERAAASIDTGDLHWVGTNVVDNSGDPIVRDGVDLSGHVEMYAPEMYQPGSSVSHYSLDLSNPDESMEPAYTGPNFNFDIDLTVPLMLDIGWDLGQCVPTEGAEVSCSNDIDDDCDTFIDSADPDCPIPCVPNQNPEFNCIDSIDNDCNGFIDGDDPNCQVVCSLSCTPNELPAEVSCSDGVDNDCDGFTDGDDSDCSGGNPICDLLPKGASCSDDSQCCSNKCRGPQNNKSCK